MHRVLFWISSRAWILYVFFAVILYLIFNRLQVVDNILNASRSGGDYVFASAYGFKEMKEVELKRALAYNQSLIAANPSITLAYNNAGFCYFYLRQLAKSMSAYQAAIDKNPYIYVFYFDLGYLNIVNGDPVKALWYYEKGGSLVPRTGEEWLKILNISPRHRDSPSLQEKSIFFKRLDYDRHMFYVYTGTILLQTKEYQKLLMRAGEGITRYPDDPQLYYFAGWASLNLGLSEDAVLLISKAIQLAPNYAEAYELRARIMKAAGKDLLYQQDMARSRLSQEQGKWQREKEVLDLHYWHDAILFFQIYR